MLAAIATVLAGCGSELDIKPATACNGALTSEARTLTSGLAEGELFAADAGLVYVEHDSGRVLSIDRCSGDAELRAELGPVSGAAVQGDWVYAVESTTAPGPARLWRVPLADGEKGVAAEIPRGVSIVGHASGVYLQDGLNADSPDIGYFKVDEPSASLSLVGVLKVYAPMTSVWLIGASDAGIYAVASFDCGCNPTLTLIPFDGSEVRSVKGTEGALSLAAVGSSLFVAADLESYGFGSSLLDIVRVPLEGGEPEVLFNATEEHTKDVRVIAASERAVCWATYASAPRCLRLTEGSSVRVLDMEERRKDIEPLVMAGDAVYWIRQEAAGEALELVGAAP